MDKRDDSERMYVLFHNRAGQAMLALYQEFKYSTAALDRQWDENVFLQQQGKYTALLKQRLDSIAFELMESLEPGGSRAAWSHSVSRFIQDYIREFGQKIRSL